MQWDLFCRVVDNFGDAGVCWRLARDLALRGQTVRLFIDDPSALAWMAPAGAAGVAVLPFNSAQAPRDVVVEAFGCNPPAAFVAGMAEMADRAPIWINLEYLSAEAGVERLHGLPSPQPGGLTKWFFYPGFSVKTGGLLRESGLMEQRAAFQRHEWLAQHGIAMHSDERLVSLFCYEQPTIEALLQRLAVQPTLLLLTPGQAQTQVMSAPSPVRLHRLRWLPQPDYDRLLWSCDLNFVRGEDSLVRAHWAGAPFVWQIYPQNDGVHAVKLEALIERMKLPPDAAAWWRAWNGLQGSWPARPDWAAWQSACTAWRAELGLQPDLTDQLLGFARGKAEGRARARLRGRC
jgi:uncharacterized repeat protein (TIGR03837 family)